MAKKVKFAAEPTKAQKLLAKLREERGTSGSGSRRSGGRSRGGKGGGS